MLQSLVTQLGAAAIGLVCLYAFIMGTWRERFGALIYLSAYLLSLGFGVSSTEHTTWYLLVADTFCLFGFFMMCWRARHPWPQWAVVGQLICVVLEVITLIDIGVRNWHFLTIETAAGWGVLLALLIGTIAAAETRRNARKAAGAKKAI